VSPASNAIASIVAVCTRVSWLVAVVLIGAAAYAASYAATHFAMTTDTDELLSPELAFRQNKMRFNEAFERAEPGMIAVIDGATPEIAERAAATLAEALAAHTDLFLSVRRPDGGDFFARNGLLFRPVDQVQKATEQMLEAGPFLGPLAQNPSLQGLMSLVDFSLDGVARGTAQPADLDRLIRALNDGLGPVAAGEPGYFSWRTMIAGKAPDPMELRRVVLMEPKRDFGKLQAAKVQTRAVRETVSRLNLVPEQGVTVRLTGKAVVADEEFASLTEHIGLIGALMFALILLMLWWATKSTRAVIAILVTTLAGLAFAAAFGLYAFGRFNVISVAFIPLFVGLGIDFGIQYTVRFRAEQRDGGPAREALIRAGEGMGRSLLIAAIAISVGFLAFFPTQYVGLSQLGAIAGAGLMMAFALSITLLPALLQISPPQKRLPETAFAPLAAIDSFVLGARYLVLAVGALAALGCLALMPSVTFDFNPLHLRRATAESIETIHSLAQSRRLTPYFINVLAPSLDAAEAEAEALEKLPEVDHAITLNNFVPKDQEPKLALIEEAAFGLEAAINPVEIAPTPSDAETAAALLATSSKLRKTFEAAQNGERAPEIEAANRLADVLAKLAASTPEVRAAASARVIEPLKTEIETIRQAIAAEPVTLDTLPDHIRNDWLAPDGRARIAVYPRGDASDTATAVAFAAAVRKHAPSATGTPISITESGAAVVRAFITAGMLSFIAITLLLYVALRRVRDVIITMTPIILTGLLTLASSVLLNEPLNFANIIALPLLFGIGVAFHIYFVLAWRAGEGHLLQSSLARGVFFSALTTATGFGTLWLSSHPGTASMGKLLMISLVWTLVSALLFQPALMGKAPQTESTNGRSRGL